MIPSLQRLLVVLSTVTCLTVGHASAAAGDNPFARPAPEPASSTPAPSRLDDLELAGAATFGGRTVVCLAERSTQRTRWVSLGSTVDGLTAVEFDAARAAVRVQDASRARWIAVRKVTIAALAIEQAVALPGASGHTSVSNAQKAAEAEAMLTGILETAHRARLASRTRKL